ncbi:aldehyde dehydrogenase [Trametes polyzona]|nr:aldehyde dehydrogenase [Trametes polyzona]
MRAKASGSIRITQRLCRPRYGPFAWHTSQDGPMPEANGREEIAVTNPANGEHISTVVSASQEDVQSAVYSAHEIFKAGIWSRAPASQRAMVLANLARDLEERVPELARIETAQTGRAIREMKAQLGRLPEWLDYYASVLRTHTAYIAPTQGPLLNYVQRVPLGVVAQITPFNHPLLIAVKKIAPALAAGNSVIVKPSELAPISVLEFAEMAIAAGVPAGVLQVLPGYGRTVGRLLVSDPAVRKVDITAGTDTGRAIGKIVGANLAHYTAELGGKAPIVVFGDADIESAVNGATFACFVASGQTCVSGTRLLVQDEVYDEFMDRFLKKVESVTRRMGNPANPKSTMGTVISLRQLERIEGIVQRGVGRILAGGQRMMGTSQLDGYDFAQGAFFPPTVIADVPTEDDLWREEIFGPVVVVKRFSVSFGSPWQRMHVLTPVSQSEQEGIDLANGCKYGLGAGIWTQNLSRAHRVSAQIQAGLVWVNAHHRNDPSSPWGGMKESGIGRENGLEAFEAYTQSKSTIVNIASAEETRSAQDWFAEEDDTEKRYG